MADPNNIPQQAQQLKEEINAPKEKEGKGADKDTMTDVASPNFDKEYEIAQQNENGSGTQSSDPNPVSRKDAAAGGNASDSGKLGRTNSPGDSDPADYLDMAKEVTQNASA